MTDNPTGQDSGTVTAAMIEAGKRAMLRTWNSCPTATAVKAIYLAMSQASLPPQDEVERLREALEHILNGALSLPRFAEEQARAALTASRMGGDDE